MMSANHTAVWPSHRHRGIFSRSFVCVLLPNSPSTTSSSLCCVASRRSRYILRRQEAAAFKHGRCPIRSRCKTCGEVIHSCTLTDKISGPPRFCPPAGFSALRAVITKRRLSRRLIRGAGTCLKINFGAAPSRKTRRRHLLRN